MSLLLLCGPHARLVDDIRNGALLLDYMTVVEDIFFPINIKLI
jgi:hypothetical protein